MRRVCIFAYSFCSFSQVSNHYVSFLLKERLVEESRPPKASLIFKMRSDRCNINFNLIPEKATGK